MAAIEPADMAVIQRHYGRVPAKEMAEFEERVGRLGEPLLAALEGLEVTLSTVARGPDDVSSDGARAAFARTTDRIKERVLACIRAIDAGDITLSGDVEAWVEGLRDTDEEATRTIPMTTHRPRRRG